MSGKRPRLLLAPVTITPSKPLTPSHLKGLLWADVLYRATAHLADVDYRYSPTTYHPTEQTLGFWEYLDRTLGEADYRGRGEEDIGELYVGYRSAGERVPASALRPYADAVERGWVHPAGARVLELWASHYARLGLHDPGLTAHQPPGMGLEEALGRLETLGLCVDHRGHGGPVHLDATRHGLPLRQIVAAGGRPNYLACALRELVPLAPRYDEIVLICDRDLETDYLLLQRVLAAFGPVVHRIVLGRVPINGRIRSARHGDWHGCSAGPLIEEASADHGEDAVRLGMRLYFIASLGRRSAVSFSTEVLHACLTRAERLLAASRTAPPADPARWIGGHQGGRGYADPYRLTTGLLARHRAAPGNELLSAVFL